MANMTFNITFDLGSQFDLSRAINAQVAPMLAQAVSAVAQQAAIDWKKSVYAAKMWSGEKDAYANSITWSMTGDFSALVQSDYKHDQEIESGRPPRDLKKMLDTSMKVRRTESGKRFLVIPMRHNTPGNGAHSPTMPTGIHQLVEAMTASRITGQSQRPSGEVTHLSPKTGMHASASQTPFLSNPKTKGPALVRRNHYQWGQRLTSQMMKQAGLNTMENKNFRGMARFDTSTPGGGKSSAFMTFRIMMDGQSGWIIPAQPGQKIAEGVVNELKPKAEKAFQEAVNLTVKSG